MMRPGRLMTPTKVVASGPAPFDPSQVAALVVWYKADGIVGLSDGDPVSTWPDSSSSGFDITGAGASRPAYKTAVVNGKPVVRFSTHILSRVNMDFFGGATDISLLIVQSPNNAAVQADMFDFRTNDNNGRFTQEQNGSTANKPYTTYKSSAGFESITPQPQFAANTFQLFEYSKNSTAIEEFINGTSVGTNTAGGGGGILQGLGTFNMGSGNGGITPWIGDVAEFIFYNAAISGSDRTKLKTYIATKYGLTIA